MLHSLPQPGAQPPRPVSAGMPHGSEARAVTAVSSGAVSSGAGGAFGDDGLTFGDVLDVINPLHHIPLVGNVYRKLSGDTIAPAARIGGGALFGGPLGAAVAAATVVAASMMERGGGAPGDAGEAAPGGVAPGGWMVAAGRPGGVPAMSNETVPAGPARDTVATTRGPARGGWMVAAARSTPPAASQAAGARSEDVVASTPREVQPGHATASADAPAVRRGGWMVAAAYAVTDSMWQDKSDTRRERFEAVA